MKTFQAGILTLLGALAACKEHNVFSFCRDFSGEVCVEPAAQSISYSIAKATRNKTVRDFANSIYFRGDRLAFELKNARSKYDMTFECLHGKYAIDAPAEKHEIEYIELKGSNVYGLVMTGSLIEKKYAAIKDMPYRALDPFRVRYFIYCGKDMIAEREILVELK